MTASISKTTFARGTLDALPFFLIVIPFGTLFGVVATEAGLNVTEVMGMSILVIAGAAQFTAVSLMQDNAPTFVVIITSLAVNLRMAMYSAALAPHLGAAPLWVRACAAYMLVDQSYAASAIAYERNNWSLSEKLGYFFGIVWPIMLSWYASTFVGALIGDTIPDWLALDFALPITFLAMIAPALRTLAHVAAAAASVTFALAFAFVPYSLGLILAALLAMMIGAEVERRTT